MIDLENVPEFNKNLKVIFVVGPTATGKSQWALDLAQTHQGCIVNIDSVQFYKGLEIGSAAPTSLEKKIVPHYLYSYLEAPAEQTAGQYLRDFYRLLANTPLKSPVFVVGGTGFYVQALEKGMYNVPEVPVGIKNQVLKEFKQGHAASLFRELKDFDPECELHENDHYRVGRALEIKRAFNLKMSEFKRQSESDHKYKFPFPYLKIGKTFESSESTDHRAKFLKYVERRTEKMLAEGLVDEVQSFINQGFTDWAPLSSVGFFEAKKFLNNELDEHDLKQAIVTSTMQLVKKQKTWFKRDPTILWSDVFVPEATNLELKIQDFLNPAI